LTEPWPARNRTGTEGIKGRPRGSRWLSAGSARASWGNAVSAATAGARSRPRSVPLCDPRVTRLAMTSLRRRRSSRSVSPRVD
jgi:hypothetical protein